MKRTTAKALSVATSLAVAGVVAGTGALATDQVTSPAVEAASYTVNPATYDAAAALNTRAMLAERASRDMANREARAQKLIAAKKKAAHKKALKAKRAAAARKAARLYATRPVTPGSARAIGKRMAAHHGWTGRQWYALDELWRHESNWGVTSGNPYGAYGIPQSLPGTKMASVGSDWRTQADTQIAWGLSYIAKRWGTPANAWAHFQSHNWY